MISILLPLGWSTMGPGCLIYLAALKTVLEDFMKQLQLMEEVYDLEFLM